MPWRQASATLLLLALLMGGSPARQDGAARRSIPTDCVVHTVPVGKTPAAVVVDAQTGRAFVANRYDDSVSVLDTHTRRLLRTVPV
jgi:DNA-binding beta-propeller fold protein YncE